MKNKKIAAINERLEVIQSRIDSLTEQTQSEYATLRKQKGSLMSEKNKIKQKQQLLIVAMLVIFISIILIIKSVDSLKIKSTMLTDSVRLSDKNIREVLIEQKKTKTEIDALRVEITSLENKQRELLNRFEKQIEKQNIKPAARPVYDASNNIPPPVQEALTEYAPTFLAYEVNGGEIGDKEFVTAVLMNRLIDENKKTGEENPKRLIESVAKRWNPNQDKSYRSIYGRVKHKIKDKSETIIANVVNRRASTKIGKKAIDKHITHFAHYSRYPSYYKRLQSKGIVLAGEQDNKWTFVWGSTV